MAGRLGLTSSSFSPRGLRALPWHLSNRAIGCLYGSSHGSKSQVFQSLKLRHWPEIMVQHHFYSILLGRGVTGAAQIQAERTETLHLRAGSVKELVAMLNLPQTVLFWKREGFASLLALDSQEKRWDADRKGANETRTHFFFLIWPAWIFNWNIHLFTILWDSILFLPAISTLFLFREIENSTC